MRLRRPNSAQFGFSLVEIAVVLVIIAILTTIIAVPLATQIEQQRVSETTRQLEAIKEAIYGFVLANGRLPCPATDGVVAGTVNSGGSESFNPLALPSPPDLNVATPGQPSNGRCAVYAGFVPAVTLGIASLDNAGFAIDAWEQSQNRIRYAVTEDTVTSTSANCPAQLGTNVNIVTATNGIRQVTMNCSTVTTPGMQPMLTVCSATPIGGSNPTGCPTGATLTTSAPFVLISLGKNAAKPPLAGTDESYNAAAGNRKFFVSRTPSSNAAPGGEFDDIVTWGNLNTLFGRMVQAGKLP